MSLFKSALVCSLIVICASITSIFAQGANTITGYVFGDDRQPLEGITVELLDDYSRTITRIRTNSTGRYFFTGMRSGRYTVHVLPLGTNYREEEQTVEIQNTVREDSSGRRIVGAFATEQRDFYLRPDRRRNRPVSNETIFAQEIPNDAQALYDEAVKLLAKKDSEEGYKKLIAAIEAFPEYFMAIERLGLEYISAKYFAAAQVLLAKAVMINPKSFNSWYGLSYAYYSMNLRAEALEAAKKAVTLDPASVDALLLEGTLLRLVKNYKDSEKDLVKAKKLSDKPVPEIHWQLALLYGKDLERFKDAADELELYLKALPSDVDTQKIRSLIKVFREKAKKS